MTNEQIAHDLAIAWSVGKQLPAQVIVEEYLKNYDCLLECLNSSNTTE